MAEQPKRSSIRHNSGRRNIMCGLFSSPRITDPMIKKTYGVFEYFSGYPANKYCRRDVPYTTDELKKIPTVLITQKHIDQKLQCLVCSNSYTLGKIVVKFACNHMYHINCIIPWIVLGAKCPICPEYILPKDEVNAQYKMTRSEITISYFSKICSPVTYLYSKCSKFTFKRNCDEVDYHQVL